MARIQIRRTRLIVACALALWFAGIPANARQGSNGDAATTKPATVPKTASGKTSTHKHHKATSKTSASSTASTKSSGKTTGKRSRKKSARARGQQKIDSERAEAIQKALIREHYLSGEATGTWNQASEEAMRRYQADHGWQSKTVPDSRALIKLGLGPSKDHLLNPESAMTTVPDAPKAEALPTTSHSAPPATDPPSTPATSPSDSSSPQ